MKVTNWRRKLATTLVAGGLMSPAAARAADLDTNLLVNPGFETVTFDMTGAYGAPQILNWTGAGFAYSHDPGTTGIPDYADGADPPGAGQWYFTANNNPAGATGDIRNPGEFYQDIDVSAGATGAKIASGEAAIRLGAFMSSYLNDNDFGNVHVEFRNAGGTALGTAQVSDLDPGPGNVWSQTALTSIVPAGTATFRVSLFGTVVNGGTDGYIDNVDVQVTDASAVLLVLQVNTATGQAAIKNLTSAPIRIDYYEITSGTGALNKTGWSSLQDQNLAGFPAGNGSGNGWEEAGGSSASVLSETYLTGVSSLAANATVPLGAAFNVGGAQTLAFRYSAVVETPRAADFDADSDVDGADFLRWQRGNGTTGAGATKAVGNADSDADVDAADLAIWNNEFGTNSLSGPGTLFNGLVRYAPTGPAVGVPEPATVILAGLGLGAIGVVARRRVG